ncbi:hypothetical protein L484_024501 [Morus notabilis]|uniref:Uncharacterized protein n=1 Tax=Morus notabilis TaxID=981085 RepID=W9S6Q0_9ROSA|nr:hypothetical protein L484_024501 [Morus notabilis]
MLPCLFPDQIRAAKLYLDAQDDDNNLHCKTCRLNREMLHVWVNLTRWKDPYGCDAAFRLRMLGLLRQVDFLGSAPSRKQSFYDESLLSFSTLWRRKLKELEFSGGGKRSSSC